MFHCSDVFGWFLLWSCGSYFGYRRWFRICSPCFLPSFEHLLLEIFGLVQGQVQKGCFPLRCLIVSSALTSISSVSRRSSLEVVAGARRPSSVSTFPDIFVAVLSRWSGKTAVSILAQRCQWLHPPWAHNFGPFVHCALFLPWWFLPRQGRFLG